MAHGQRLSSSGQLERLHQHPQFPEALALVRTLLNEGHQAVLAGGCVRDSLLGLKPKDIDIATSALPEIVQQLFPRTLAVGKAFGTIVVLQGESAFEVTTFRRDGPYLDGRHPSEVKFSDMETDSRRRDFTINALFYDPVRTELVDFVKGVDDLVEGRLVTVGRAEERFSEDRLRMLRAVRFHAQLGFGLDESVIDAIRKQSTEISQVSIERCANELRLLLLAKHARSGLHQFKETGLYAVLWPELAHVDLVKIKNFLPFSNWESGFSAVQLLANQTREASMTRLRQWRVSRESLRRVQEQMSGAIILSSRQSTSGQRAHVLGGEEFAAVLDLTAGLLDCDLDQIDVWIQDYLKVTGSSATLPAPLVTGRDLIAIGIPPGEKMGSMLKDVYTAQLERRLASRDEALNWVRARASRS